jgi:hypothetical protein
MPNRMDPMAISGQYRDPFPKLGLYGGFIGDGYPLCTELPPKHFLKKGATYRLAGSALRTEMEYEPYYYNMTKAQRFQLDSNSKLYETLCNANNLGKCVYRSNIVLTENLDCYGTECAVDNVNMVLLEEDIKYEYVRQPCVELAFYNSQELNKITSRYYRGAMCLNKNIDDVAMHACCLIADNPLHWMSVHAENFCDFSFEKSSFATNQDRCQNINTADYPSANTCDWISIRNSPNNENDRGYCNFWIHPHDPDWHWTNQTCNMMVKGKNQS